MPVGCEVLNNNLASLGTCIAQETFGGETIIFGLALLIAFSIIFWKARMPLSVAFPFGWVLLGALVYAGIGGPAMFILWHLGLVAAGLMLAKGVMSLGKN